MSSIPIQSHRFYGSLSTANIALLTGMQTGDYVYDSTLSIMKVYNGTAWVPLIQTGVSKLTPEGGVAVRLTNKSGAPTVKGELVQIYTLQDNAAKLAAANALDCVGAFYESGIADGSEVWVVIGGISEVLLDANASTRGNWVGTGATPGRADASGPVPAPPTAAQHFQEIGHCLESKAGNTLCKIVMHFN